VVTWAESEETTNQSIMPATARTDSHGLAHALDRRLADDGGHGGLARARPRVPADDLPGGRDVVPEALLLLGELLLGLGVAGNKLPLLLFGRR